LKVLPDGSLKKVSKGDEGFEGYVVGLGLTGVLIVSGLEQVADHMLGVEIITEYLARKGEQL
jgi:uncharacterized protein (UPF0303 family)